MASDYGKLKSKLATLENSLDELEAQLEPLFAQTLPETLVGLDTIQQAKLQIAIPYLVNGLLFVYLKSRGIDPKTHPVVAELERTRQYFEKVKNAEKPAQRTTAIDKDASSRFIKHAIAQAQSPGQAPKAAGPSHIRFNETIERVPVKVTSKMREREQYENELKESNAEDSEEEELEVFEDELSEQQSDGNGKGKAKAPSPSPPQLASDSSKTKKRRRPVADVFAGYGSDNEKAMTKENSAAGTPSAGPASSSDKEKKKKRKKAKV